MGGFFRSFSLLLEDISFKLKNHFYSMVWQFGDWIRSGPRPDQYKSSVSIPRTCHAFFFVIWVSTVFGRHLSVCVTNLTSYQTDMYHLVHASLENHGLHFPVSQESRNGGCHCSSMPHYLTLYFSSVLPNLNQSAYWICNAFAMEY